MQSEIAICRHREKRVGQQHGHRGFWLSDLKQPFRGFAWPGVC